MALKLKLRATARALKSNRPASGERSHRHDPRAGGALDLADDRELPIRPAKSGINTQDEKHRDEDKVRERDKSTQRRQGPKHEKQADRRQRDCTGAGRLDLELDFPGFRMGHLSFRYDDSHITGKGAKQVPFAEARDLC